MYVLEQGKAPAIRTATVKGRNGKPDSHKELFHFIGRKLETEDKAIAEAAIKAGAVLISGPTEEPESSEKSEQPDKEQ